MRSPKSITRPCAIALLAAAAVAAQSTTVNVQVGNQTNTSVGVKGRLQLAMSTSFQLASWDDQLFSGAPNAPAELTTLNPWHTRVQVVSDAIPLTPPAPGISRNSTPCSPQSRAPAITAPSSRSVRLRLI